jgi:hypothetical protein
VSAAAGAPLPPLILPEGTVIHMIAFAGYTEARSLVERMMQRANGHRDGIAHETAVVTGEDFVRAARAPVDLMLVSAHGPRDELAEPALGDGQGNRADLRPLGGSLVPFAFGARAGIIWDACYIGQPAFWDQLARLSAPGVAHVGPAEKIWPEDSDHVAGPIIDELLAPGRPPVTPAAFAAAAARAAAMPNQVMLRHGYPGGKDPG